MRYFATTLFSLLTSLAFSQNSRTISGSVIEPLSKKPIAAATVQVFQSRESGDTLLRGGFAGADGSFVLNGITTMPNSILVISALGFDDYEMDIDWKRIGKNKLEVGSIEMKAAVNALENVVITGRRKAFEMKLDRRVFNPDQQLTSKGGTALDVFKNIPSVSVDPQGNVEMRNSTPVIFVDGRPTILSLEQIAADDIDRVEIITNPSARYDASTTGGIINVILKKNKARGLNGNVSAGFGYPDILTGYVGLNLRQGKLNLFATANYNQSGGRAKGETDRTNFSNGMKTGSFNQTSYNDRLRKSSNARIGADYFFDDKNTLSISQGISGNDGRSVGEQTQNYLDGNDVIYENGFRDELYNWNSSNASTQIFYKKTFAKKDRELTADFTYNKGQSNNTSNFTNYLTKTGASLPYSINQVKNDGSSNNDQVTVQIDYVNPYGENGRLEAGLRSYSNDYNSSFNAYRVENTVESKLPLSNNIHYKENVNAGYINYGNKITKWGLSFQAGLRVELSEFNGTLIDSAKSFGYKYPAEFKDIFKSMFPSLYLTKDVSENAQIQLNYSRRIRRPSFWNLNPFVDISDPLNIRQGNINLIPETVHSFELNYNQEYEKGNFLVSAYFRNNVDDITRYSDTLTKEQFENLNNASVNPNAILNTYINADYTNRMGLELTLQHKFTDRFDIMPNINFQYRKVKAEVGTLNLNNEGFNWEAKMTANYKIASKKTWLDNLGFQVTGDYESRKVIPQGKTIPEIRMDAAIRKDFLKNNKASLVFSVEDVFNSRRWGNEITTPQFTQENYSRWNVRSFRLTFSFRFGNNEFQLLNKGKRGGGEGMGGGEEG